VTKSARQLALSAHDRARMDEVAAAAASGDGAVGTLIAWLGDPSWPVRRSVVAGLARLGDDAIPALIETLRERRDHEGRVAATVDALATSRADPEARLLALGATDVPPAVLCDIAQILGRRRSATAVETIAR
jgi:hypothetical protein